MTVELPYSVGTAAEKRFSAVYTDKPQWAYSSTAFKDFGIITPEEDPGWVHYNRDDLQKLCQQHRVRYSQDLDQDQIGQLDADCKNDQHGFDNQSYLPKGVMKLNGYDASKENLVINYTEDSPSALPLTLTALDKLFKLSSTDAIKDKYNIFLIPLNSLHK